MRGRWTLGQTVGHGRDPLVLVSRPAPGVALVVLNRPDKRNALSTALREEACRILDDLAGDEWVRALVVTGAGTTLSAGFDLAEFGTTGSDPGFSRRPWASSDAWHRRWITFPVPAVAAVTGDRLDI